MGGIIVRHYLSENNLPNLGRLVMLGPPNQGSEVVDFLKKSRVGEFVLGPAFNQLGTGRQSLPNNLGPAPCETGIIAGSRSINLINSMIIPGADDGKVSLKRARLRGMKDYLVVQRTHPLMMNSKEVQDQVLHFIKQGRFE